MTDDNSQNYFLWVAPAVFCGMPYINDRRYLPANEESKERRSLSRSEASVTCKCAASKSIADYRKKEMLLVVTLRNINVWKEPLVNYDMEYLF